MRLSSAAITTWWIYCISYLMALSLNTASASSAAQRLPQPTVTTLKAEQSGLGTITLGLEGIIKASAADVARRLPRTATNSMELRRQNLYPRARYNHRDGSYRQKSGYSWWNSRVSRNASADPNTVRLPGRRRNTRRLSGGMSYRLA